MSFPSRHPTSRNRSASLTLPAAVRKAHSNASFHNTFVTKSPNFDVHQKSKSTLAQCTDDSGSEDDEKDRIPVAPISTTQLTQKQLIDSPEPMTADSLKSSFKEKLTISRKQTKKSSNKHMHDDLTVYPPPQKHTGQRDQYGFLKSSQWISEGTFNEFENYYAPIMKRRLLKWRQLLAEHNDQWPPRNSKTKRYIRKGIPPELRGQAWLHYSGAKAKMDQNKTVYYDLVQHAEKLGHENEYLDIIERDLHRTFPENQHFKPESYRNSTDEENTNILIIQSLRRVLLAFSVYCPVIGYCQSLNYIAGMLLLFMNEEEAFWTFVVLITEILPPNVYDVTMEGANIDQNVLMSLISEKCPQIWHKLSGGKSFWECEKDNTGMPTTSLVTSHWFLTLFINILPIESVLRVWDCMFYDGQKVLFRVALGIFKLNEDKIFTVDDSLEVFQIVQNMPKCMIDCHKLIDGTYLQFASTTRVSDEEINDRRDLFRQRRDERRRNSPTQTSRKLTKRSTVRGTIVHRAKEARYYVERAKTVRK